MCNALIHGYNVFLSSFPSYLRPGGVLEPPSYDGMPILGPGSMESKMATVFLLQLLKPPLLLGGLGR